MFFEGPVVSPPCPLPPPPGFPAPIAVPRASLMYSPMLNAQALMAAGHPSLPYSTGPGFEAWLEDVHSPPSPRRRWWWWAGWSGLWVQFGFCSRWSLEFGVWRFLKLELEGYVFGFVLKFFGVFGVFGVWRFG